MRIAIDARAYSWAGIGRYIRNLLIQLAVLAHGHKIIVLLNEEDSDLYNGPFDKVLVDGSYYSWREQIVGWRQMQRVTADLWHFTHFNVPWFFKKPYVVTIHDVTRFIFPGQKRQGLAQQVAYEALFVRAVQRARHIITVSASTARSLEVLPISGDAPRTIIHEGVEEKFFAPITKLARTKVRMLLGTDDPYVLSAGVWMSHKNLERLMQAYALVSRRHPHSRLVMTGRPVPGYANLIEIARRSGIAKAVLFPGFVADDLMPALYAEACCFVFPSLYEGFGLPALEAAATGTPVVASNVSSTRELLWGAAELVNPESIANIAAGIVNVLDNEDDRRKWQIAGRARAAQFQWSEAARRHLSIYESVTE